MSPSSSILIKGYLPIRITLPKTQTTTTNNNTTEKTVLDEHSFLYLKEHIVTNTTSRFDNDNENNKHEGSTTLFVVNIPTLPSIRTKLFLHSLFDRFGNVSRVTVVKDPRSSYSASGGATTPAELNDVDNKTESKWRHQFQNTIANDIPNELLSYREMDADDDDVNDEGKFAHVVFESNKEMKRALKRLTCLMSGDDHHDGKKKKKKSKKNKKKESKVAEEEVLPAVAFGRVELQELEDESKRLRKKDISAKKNDEDDFDFTLSNDNDDNDDDDEENEEAVQGIQALVQIQKQSIIPRDRLLQACNIIMSKFETAEEEAEKARKALANQPDEDGFITVSSTSTAKPTTLTGNNTSKRQLERGMDAVRRKSGNKRSRKQKESIGSTQLKDFYKFQMKESRKRGLNDLRRRFEEDLVRVQKMKEQKQYRPF
mmetsp:Transcript_34030/g.49854  ORF Transcript_34030/g.49854 Transcript_34030/m.49854 type:complete len:429 (-) Transcript_34030:163-1449(-)